jgi:uncharacterized protein YjbI with pentapeptide repeats
LVALAVFIALSYVFIWEWTGFPQKSLFDWIQILVIPIAVAIGTFILNRAAKRRDDAAQLEQRKQAEAVEVRCEEEAALQAYFDYMSGMLTDPDRPLRRSYLGDALSVAVRAQTLTVLGRVQSGERKRSVLHFLYEARLISKKHPIISLVGARLERVDLSGSNLSGAYLERVFLFFADLSGTNLEEAILENATFWAVDLEGANLRRAKLEGAHLYTSDFQDANLQGASLQGAEIGGIYLEGDYLEGAYLEGTDLRGADLQGAGLRDVDLQGADLRGADLRGANLKGSDLQGVDLQGVDLRKAVLAKVDLRGAKLQGVDLREALLVGADLRGADFRGSDLQDAYLAGIEFEGEYLEGADLREAKGLTQGQLEEALGDKTTKVPEELELLQWWLQRGGA